MSEPPIQSRIEHRIRYPHPSLERHSGQHLMRSAHWSRARATARFTTAVWTPLGRRAYSPGSSR